jgi:hypothetical protein
MWIIVVFSLLGDLIPASEADENPDLALGDTEMLRR